MQRNRRKLADILNRRIPRQAVVQVRHNPHIDPGLPSLFDQADHDLLLRRNRKEDLVHKQRSRDSQAVPYIADHVVIARLRLPRRQRNKSLEPESKVLMRFQVISKRMAHPSRAHDHHIARLDPLQVPPVHDPSPQRPSQAQQKHRDHHHQRDHNPRHRHVVREVQRPAQQQARRKRRLHRHPDLVQPAPVLDRAIHPVRPRHKHQANRKPSHIGRRHPGSCVEQHRQHRKRCGRRRNHTPQPERHNPRDKHRHHIERTPHKARDRRAPEPPRPMRPSRSFARAPALPGYHRLLYRIWCRHSWSFSPLDASSSVV